MPLDQAQSKIVFKTSSGLVQVNPETSIEAVDGLSTALSSAVHKTGAETVDGIKTFIKNTMAEAVPLSTGAIDVTLGCFFTKTIDADTTFTFTGTPSGKSCAFSLILTNGGSHLCTFPASVTWIGGQAPTLKTTGIDVLTFFTVNGGTSWMEVSGGGAASGGGGGSIADSGVVAGTYGPSANAAPAYGDSFVIPQITVNQKGQITQILEKTITIPASDNTDIQVQVIANGWNKAYLLGMDASNQISGAPINVTAMADPDIYITTSQGELHATTFTGNLNGTASRATADSTGANIANTYAKLASPALTGTPTAPTATAGTSTTQIATTAFVAEALSGYVSNVSDYVGATSSADGTAGLVPAALSSQKDYFLRGDGVWAQIVSTGSGVASIADYVGATSSADGTAGLVPAATSAERGNVLQGDGTWTAVVHLSGDESVSGAKTFAQGPYGTAYAVSGTEISLANGSVFTKTVSADTAFTITGVPSGKAATFSLILTNGGAYQITWPASVKWAGGNVPTLSTSGTDLLTFLTPDGGTTWYGVLSVGGAA